jgi:hypothetical protein
MNDLDHDTHQQIMRECYSCTHRRNVPGNAHIACVKPDPAMTGEPHGIKNGWFYYPMLFDPVWKTKLCSNYERKDTA